MKELYQSLIKISNLIKPNFDISAYYTSQYKQEKINFVNIFTSIPMVYDLNFMVIESFQPISELENSDITISRGGYIPYGYVLFDKDVDFVLSSCNLKNIVKLSHSICWFRYYFTDQVVYD